VVLLRSHEPRTEPRRRRRGGRCLPCRARPVAAGRSAGRGDGGLAAADLLPAQSGRHDRARRWARGRGASPLRNQ
jgi:hypothetical protein